MALKITEAGDYVTIGSDYRIGKTTLNREEQQELLEALARIHGFSLVDHVERRELVEKVEEVRGLRHKAYGGAADGWQETLGAAEALVEAVADALDLVPQIPDIPVTQSAIIPREV